MNPYLSLYRINKTLTIGIIRYNFKFDRNFRNYCKWILNEFDVQQKTNFDTLANKNVKFLVYRYDDLRASGSDELIKIRHSLVTDKYLAAEKNTTSRLAVFY